MREPVQAERAGPLLDSLAQRILAARLAAAEHGHGEWRIAITNKNGRVVQYHALHTRTLRGLIREAKAVDQTWCLFPTCTTSALRCQADHATPYAETRTTRDNNIENLCPSDHAAKTTGSYHLQRIQPTQNPTNHTGPDTPAGWQLTMRSGHTYTIPDTPPTTEQSNPPPF